MDANNKKKPTAKKQGWLPAGCSRAALRYYTCLPVVLVFRVGVNKPIFHPQHEENRFFSPADPFKGEGGQGREFACGGW